ncbi:uncharacterized protein EV154DRAFT_488776 [Mucor mucedo]|uniref:uncharacterized protein n=1 Tax=Mucor mucedo TaxID=29922 RepID=UPI00221E54C1|nr:uncharacterized protein EV154DRAFT_488776 [Mucor mucedo]KAI7865117.1 hypothetical protein EV154DRAFT_488776 [Mucor mucedo]
MNTIALPSSFTTMPSSSVTDNGFYTGTLPTPADDTAHITRDRKNLIIGCVLGVILFLSFLVAFVFTIKLYQQRKKQAYNNQDQLEKTSFLVLDPGSQFSLAVKRASEVPSSPTY